ncbi:DUF6292 family protein [Actinocrispum wychmicini]|uniref:DUF6292 family protein n=1 Tax=Actinocrispum wychmicini TaxID=1213861 RepID=UPI0010524B52|nr:DUF6292 family protein [Actinocrispum wychmicini]
MEPWSVDDGVHALSRGLAGYLSAVAHAVGVPAEGTSFEVSDTATAYLALTRRWSRRPGKDLMLVWSERTGWALLVETDPGETPVSVARLGGECVPPPEVVARFVADALTGPGSQPATAPVPANRTRLTESLTRYST